MTEKLPIAGNIGRFRPTTLRQFLIFHIASRFDDLRNLERYLADGVSLTKGELLDLAMTAERRTLDDGSPPTQNFWSLLAGRREAA